MLAKLGYMAGPGMEEDLKDGSGRKSREKWFGGYKKRKFQAVNQRLLWSGQEKERRPSCWIWWCGRVGLDESCGIVRTVWEVRK